MDNLSLPVVNMSFDAAWAGRRERADKIGSKITVAELITRDGTVTVHAGYDHGWRHYAGDVVTAGTTQPRWIRRIGTYWPGDETLDSATAPREHLTW